MIILRMLAFYLIGLISIDIFVATCRQIAKSVGRPMYNWALDLLIYGPFLLMIGLFSYALYRGNEEPGDRKLWIIGAFLVFLIGSPACFMNAAMVGRWW